MGCWSATIMGGDSPMDYLSLFKETLGIDEDTRRPIIRDRINAKIRSLVAMVRRETNEGEYDERNIAGQVLGVMILQSGAKMPGHVRELILKCINEDHWATSPIPDDAKDDRNYAQIVKQKEERKFFIKKFRQQIERYPADGRNKPTNIAHEGLLDAMAKHLEAPTKHDATKEEKLPQDPNS